MKVAPFIRFFDYRSYFLMKNITPNQLALGISVVFCLLSLLWMLLLNWLITSDWPIAYVLIATIFNTLIGYVLFYFALERFIYRRIKLIYKRIHRLKQEIDSHPEKVNMNQHIMEEVEAEVVKWSEENKEKIEQLEQLAIYRREFLGNVSHELKTPVSNIQGYLYTLIDSKLSDENINMRYLKKAAKNAERLHSIIKELETIALHEAGVLKLTWEAFSIYDLAQEVINATEMLAKKNDVKITFKEGCEQAIQVKADREKIRQVLTNLLTNSIKYGKTATFIGIYDMDRYVLIEVTDDGRGIAAKHLPRLFERFYRVDDSRSRKKGGSGLGLAIVKHIVEAHNQSVHVRSKKGVGTTFGFTLAKVRE